MTILMKNRLCFIDKTVPLPFCPRMKSTLNKRFGFTDNYWHQRGLNSHIKGNRQTACLLS